jgi:hypothetical protein
MKARQLRPQVSTPAAEGAWRTSDLPAGLQAELGARVARAERGEGLLPYDEAMAEVDRKVEEILAVASDPAPSR